MAYEEKRKDSDSYLPVCAARKCSNILTRYERGQAIFRYNNLSKRGNCIRRAASTTTSKVLREIFDVA